MEVGLGEIGESVTTNPIEYENSSEDIEIDTTKYSPEFYPEKPKKLTTKDLHCKTCGNNCAIHNMIDGECPICAVKHLRKLETRLVQLNQIKKEHEFCAIDGHGETYKNKLFPTWNGLITINGIELYPVFPLCKDCLDILSAYLVYFLEERGILRRGSDKIKNKFSQEYGMPLTKVEKNEALLRLSDFINAASVYVFDKVNPMNTLYTELKNRRKLLLTNEQKGMKEWLKKKEAKLPTNQIELLQLAEKYYPCLQNDTDEQRLKLKEIDWLKRQPVPTPVLIKVAKIVEQAIQMLHLQLDPEEVEQQKWNKQSLTSWLKKEKKVDELDLRNLWKWVQEQTEIALGPFADSAGEVLDQAMEKVTLSNLISESTIDE